MAISDTQKVDFLLKKKSRLLKQKQIQTQIKKASNEANPSPLLLRGDKV